MHRFIVMPNIECGIENKKIYKNKKANEKKNQCALRNQMCRKEKTNYK